MARRGALTALQAVLAGVSGGAQGYVQQQELERKRQQERAAQERQQAMDLITFGERAIEPGPLATRAPMGAPRAEAPRTALPTSAVPLPTGPMDFGGAMRQLEQEEARPSGTTPLRIGDITLNIPIGQRARDIKQSEALLAERSALDAAMREAEATGTVRARQEREAFDVGNRRQFEVYRQQYQGRGEYNPNLDYASLNAAKEAQLQRTSAQQIARIREGGQAGGGTAAAGGRGLLPSVVGTARRLDQMDIGYVRSLRPSGVVAAAEAPLMMAEAKGIAKAPAFLLSGAMNAFANENEREYALLIRSVNDAVARASEKGVLTDRDIGRFQAQVLPLSNDDEDTSLRKFNTLKGWASWLNTGNLQARTPEETDEEFNERMANARAKGIDVTAPAAATAPGAASSELEQDRRDWDDAVRKYGRVRVEREYGPRP